uniref:Uncharacterized protein n=1 Tax=Anguilla anguilla TaxID=7936 RepID=A0A0E9VD16_ANGAN
MASNSSFSNFFSDKVQITSYQSLAIQG